MVPLGQGSSLEVTGERSPKGVGNRRHHEPDDLGLTGAQLAGGAVGPVAEAADGLLDAFAGPRLRAAIHNTHAAQWRRLYEQCDLYRTQTPPSEHPTASITYFGPAAANLALAYQLTGQPGYLAEAWRWISTAIRYPHWGKANLPDHDLDAGWLLHGLSLAYSWLRHDLDAEAAAELRTKLELQGQRMYDYAVATEGRWWSSSYWQNHNWICYAGLATAGYVLERPEWTARARDNFATVLAELPTDGSDHEGVVYWRYGVPWLAIYLDLLQHAEGADWWRCSQFLANTFWYRLHQTAPGFEQNVDHGDCHDRRSGHSVALYYKLASAYRIGQAQWLAEQVATRFFWREAYASGVKPGVLAEAFLELLWYDPDVPAVPVDDATTPKRAYFPDLGLVTARTSWSSDGTLVSFKAAPGGGHHAWNRAHRLQAERGWDTLNAGHHHPDAGSFVLAGHGAFLLVEDGYNNRKRAAHHNLILVDGRGFAGEDRYHVYKDAPPTRTAQLTDVLTEGGWVHATADLTAMYDVDLRLRHVRRTLACTPSGALVLRDDLAAEIPHEWTTLLHSDWPAEPWPSAHDQDLYAIRNGPGQAWVRPHAPARAVIQQVDTAVEANPTASTPSLAISKTLRTLRVSTVGHDTEAQFLTSVETTSALHPTPPTAVEVSAESGCVIRFDSDRGPELVMLADARGRIRCGAVDADAAAVLLARGTAAVVAATRVSIAGEVVVDSPDPVTGALSPDLGIAIEGLS